jgi:hypothetical protein
MGLGIAELLHANQIQGFLDDSPPFRCGDASDS